MSRNITLELYKRKSRTYYRMTPLVSVIILLIFYTSECRAGANLCPYLPNIYSKISENLSILEASNSKLPSSFQYRKATLPLGVVLHNLPPSFSEFIRDQIDIFVGFNDFSVDFNTVKKSSVLFLGVSSAEEIFPELNETLNEMFPESEALNGLAPDETRKENLINTLGNGIKNIEKHPEPSAIMTANLNYGDNFGFVTTIFNFRGRTGPSELTSEERKRLIQRIVVDLGLPPVGQFQASIFSDNVTSTDPTLVDVGMLRILAISGDLKNWRNGLNEVLGRCNSGQPF